MKYSADGWWGGEERPLMDRLLEMQGGDSVEKEKVDFHITRVGEDEVRGKEEVQQQSSRVGPPIERVATHRSPPYAPAPRDFPS